MYVLIMYHVNNDGVIINMCEHFRAILKQNNHLQLGSLFLLFPLKILLSSGQMNLFVLQK